MNTQASHPLPASEHWPKVLGLLGWLLLVAAIVYFVGKHVPRFFTFTPESYGKHYWPSVHWVVPHVVCGLLALLIGPIQFWPRLRRDYLQVHRISGRLYVMAVCIGSVSSFGLAIAIEGKPGFALGLTGLGVAWMVTTGMAFIAIRRKNIVQHRQWMVRSYVVTFAFITFRLASDLMKVTGVSLPNPDRAAVLAWGCWAVPLLITEVVLQGNVVFRTKEPAGEAP